MMQTLLYLNFIHNETDFCSRSELINDRAGFSANFGKSLAPELVATVLGYPSHVSLAQFGL